MSRVFLMKWYHFSVEYFEDLRNVNHCEFLIMRKKEDSGKYILENNLRTWSELKRERLALAGAKEKEKTSNGNSSSTLSLTSAAEKAVGGVNDKDKEKEKKMGLGGIGDGKEVVTRKKWGGCPNGCNHGKPFFKKENSMHAMVTNGRPAIMSSTSTTTSPILAASENGQFQQQSIQFRRPVARRWQYSSEDEADPRGMAPFAVDVDKSLEDAVSSPDGTPSFISVEDRLRSRLKSPASAEGGLLSVGGARRKSSLEGSDTDHDNDSEMFSAEEDLRKREAKGRSIKTNTKKRNGTGGGIGSAGMSPVTLENYRGALADALGDQSDVGSDAGTQGDMETEMSKLEIEEKVDRSIRGSVY